MIVTSKVKQYIREKDMSVAHDLYDELNKYLSTVLDKAIKRAQENGRKTVASKDL